VAQGLTRRGNGWSGRDLASDRVGLSGAEAAGRPSSGGEAGSGRSRATVRLGTVADGRGRPTTEAAERSPGAGAAACKPGSSFCKPAPGPGRRSLPSREGGQPPKLMATCYERRSRSPCERRSGSRRSAGPRGADRPALDHQSARAPHRRPT